MRKLAHIRNRTRSNRPPLDYDEMGIPAGSILKCTMAPICVTVVSPRRIALEGIEVSLSHATAKILGEVRGRDPAKYWKYGDRMVQEIYDDTYPCDSHHAG